ncbi:MAG: methyltransferase domain-containing protein [Vulcanimicrobiota bacterium]
MPWAPGAGEHDLHLSKFYRVDGLDLNAGFLTLARQKNPAGEYFHADMTGFSLGRKYDAVLCLFSSIGYVKTVGNLRKSLACFRDHLNDNGVIIIEPWFTPETWTAGRVHMSTVDSADLKLCRMNISEVMGTVSFFTFHYLVGTPEGVEHFNEQHELGLFKVGEMKEAFATENLEVEHDPSWLSGRGLYVGKKKAENR